MRNIYLLVIIQMLHKKYLQHYCHMPTVSSRDPSFVDMNKDAVQDNLHSGWLQVKNNTVQLLASLLDADRRWTARVLAAEVGVCHKTVVHILHDILGYCKFAERWILHETSEMQQWHRYVVAQSLLDR